MFLTLSLLARLQFAVLIPPPVPPDPEALSAATVMLERHPPSSDVIDGAIDKALEAIANGTVSQAYRGEWGGQRWLAYRERFVGNIRPMVAAHRREMAAYARDCVASRFAYGMTASEVSSVDAFLATPSGQSFWKIVGPSQEVWSSCIYVPARARIDIDKALVASGLPRLDQPPLQR